MVEVVNRSQQVKVRTLTPKPSYSRIVGLTVYVPADGVIRYMSTPPLGQNLWLLHIHAQVRRLTANVARHTIFGMYAGANRPNSLVDVQSWDIIMPLYDQNRNIIEWHITDGESTREWDMDKFYAGHARRLAITYARFPGWGENWLTVCFRISEG